MNLLKRLNIFAIVISLSACSSAVFPEIVDEDAEAMYEGQSLGNDEKNVAYEDEPTSAKRIPVYEENPEGYREVKVKTNSEKFNRMLEEGDPSVSKPSKSDYKTLVVEPQKDTDNDNVIQTEQNYVPSVNYQVETFYFDNGSSSLTGSYGSQVRKVAKLAKEHNAIVTVYGYSSSRTRNTDIASHKMANFKVSSERAESVARALRRAGVPAKNIKIEALSDTNPAYLEVMPEGERLNRRAEVYISY